MQNVSRTIGHLFTRTSFVYGDRATILRVPAPHGEVLSATIGETHAYVTVNPFRVTVWDGDRQVDGWEVTTPRADAARAARLLLPILSRA